MVFDRDGTCAVQEVVPAEGHVITPTDEAVNIPVVAVKMETTSPGRIRLRGVAVSYAQNDAMFEQTFPVELNMNVAEEADPPAASVEEAECLDLATLLPGVRLPDGF
jgi:hypothetical protein